MTDKPILFSAPMVRALLEGRKTQDRRVLKPQLGSGVDQAFQFTPGHWRFIDQEGCRCHQVLRLPYTTGDRLWVREAWRATDSLDHMSPTQIGEAAKGAGYRGAWCPYITEADGVAHNWGDEDRGVPMFGDFSDTPGRFRQGMHMPRWASRLTLTVTDVRIQRVQEISYDDIAAEGIEVNKAGLVIIGKNAHSPKAAFRALWDSLNDKRNLGWEANPWVAAYTFTVETRNIDA